jgi:hypothetical protein
MARNHQNCKHKHGKHGRKPPPRQEQNQPPLRGLESPPVPPAAAPRGAVAPLVPRVVAPVARAVPATAAAVAPIQAGVATTINFSWDPHLSAPHGGVPGPITVRHNMPPHVCTWILDSLERPTRVPEYSPLGGLLDENELRECAIELEQMYHKDHGAPQGCDSMSNVPAALQLQLIQLGCTKACRDRYTGTNLQSILDVIRMWHKNLGWTASPL